MNLALSAKHQPESARQATPAKANRPLIQRRSGLGENMIQRKSGSCACGGGCPRCQEQTLLQTKLKISEPGDRYEQEADRIAEQVMQMPEPSVQRQVEPEAEEELQRQPLEEEEEEEEETLQTKPLAEQITPLVQRQAEPMEEEEEEETLQTKTTSGQPLTVSSSLQNRITALQGGGQSLPQSERNFFEPRFGTDFSQVRIHAGSQAAETASAINARAFTLGRDVVFGAGQYQPSTFEGRRLFAHELTHVMQQSEMPSAQIWVPTASRPDDQRIRTLRITKTPDLQRQAYRDCTPARTGRPDLAQADIDHMIQRSLDIAVLQPKPVPKPAPEPSPGSGLIPNPPPGVLPIRYPKICLIIITALTLAMEAYKRRYVHEQHWRDVMDAWFYETGPNPATYSGLGDPRNRSIADNAGFIVLFLRWFAGKRTTLSDGSLIHANGFRWRYELPVSNTPGGAAAYDSATQFLGSYDAQLTRVQGGVQVRITNRSNWGSGTRIPQTCRQRLRSRTGMDIGSILSDHERGRGPCSFFGFFSRGGNFDQVYTFTIADNMLADLRRKRQQRRSESPPRTPVADMINEFCKRL